MFASLATLLIYAGYRLPLARDESLTPPENFVLTLHKESGAPLDEGSTIAQSKKALLNTIPDAPVQFGRGNTDQLFEMMRGKRIAARVAVDCERLPDNLKRWVGKGYNGNHAVSIVRAQWSNGKKVVFWIDPMGRPWEGYVGEWVEWDTVAPAFLKGVGDIVNFTFVEKSAASRAATE